MDDQENLKRVFTGSFVEAQFVASLLEENGIGALVRNTLGESIIAGWASGAPEDAGLVFVAESHMDQATAIIKNYQDAEE